MQRKCLGEGSVAFFGLIIIFSLFSLLLFFLFTTLYLLVIEDVISHIDSGSLVQPTKAQALDYVRLLVTGWELRQGRLSLG